MDLTIEVRLEIDADSGGFRISIKRGTAHPNPKIRQGAGDGLKTNVSRPCRGPAGPKNKVGAWVQDPPLDPPMAEAVSLFYILYHVLLLYFTAI